MEEPEEEGRGKDGRLAETWEEMVVRLKLYQANGQLESVEPAAAEDMWGLEEAPVAFVDVRTETDFEEVHAIGTVNIPVFRPIEGDSFIKNQRRLANALFGNFNATEENIDFLEEMEAQVEDDLSTPVMLICRNGGAVTAGGNTENRSRSLVAAFKLLSAGFEKVYYVKGGLRAWFQADLPTTLTDEEVF